MSTTFIRFLNILTHFLLNAFLPRFFCFALRDDIVNGNEEKKSYKQQGPMWLCRCLYCLSHVVKRDHVELKEFCSKVSIAMYTCLYGFTIRVSRDVLYPSCCNNNNGDRFLDREFFFTRFSFFLFLLISVSKNWNMNKSLSTYNLFSYTLNIHYTCERILLKKSIVLGERRSIRAIRNDYSFLLYYFFAPSKTQWEKEKNNSEEEAKARCKRMVQKSILAILAKGDWFTE